MNYHKTESDIMQLKNKGKYILLLNIHGLIRGKELELGRDADTGGQTKYVLDLARALGEHKEVDQVDLITREVKDKNCSADYAKHEEVISDNVRIVRIKAGPDEYIRKELLWDYLDNFMDNLTNWLNNQERLPDFVHSHYADGGYVGVRVASLFSIPLIHTGHSLGRDKRKRLLSKGLTRENIENTYHISTRINAEEEILENADLVITSTHNEVEEQYGLYNYYDPSIMAVIPPGTDLSQFYPMKENESIAFEKKINRFLKTPDKPLILSLSRPDERKNILTLIEVFGESLSLQKAANLLIIAGIREDILEMEEGAQNVLTNILLLIDSYDLYGKVAIPKSHEASEVPNIYRLTAASGGIFINPALTEPFGLTLLEAAACGVPIVATENGGPVDIINNCKNGLLIDPLDKTGITESLLSLLKDKKEWSRASKNGLKNVKKHYSWQAHVNSYINQINKLNVKHKPIPSSRPLKASKYRDHAIFSDLDQSLVGNPEALQRFSQFIKKNRKKVIFGISTGRRIDSALVLIRKHKLVIPDILISSLGTRIHYGKNLIEDSYWKDHIDRDWNRNRIRRILSKLPGLNIQPKAEQSQFKLSYYYDQELAPDTDEIISLLRSKDINTNVFLSFGQFLDFIPARASKGKALRYVSQRQEIPIEQILVAGGTGTDEDMIRGNTLGVVVSNPHEKELEQLPEMENIYFSKSSHADGILEAIEYYNLIDL